MTTSTNLSPTTPRLIIRDAVPTDASSCAEIYGPYCTSSIITFELVPLTPTEMAGRIAAAQSHAFLVAELDGIVVGYAYAGAFNPRLAYRWSCTTTVYLSPTARGKGIGKALYQALLDRLRDRGYRQAFAGISQPNAASNGIHEKMGFERVARYRRVGWKLGKWHDVVWYQLDLSGEGEGEEEGQPPAEPR
jgi:L-amino acid N-acyltransferase YncA